MHLKRQKYHPADCANVPELNQGYGMYRFFNVTLGSQFPLPELCDYQKSTPSISVRQIHSARVAPGEFETRYEWRNEQGRLLCRCGRQDGSYLLHLPSQANFYVGVDGNIDCLAFPGTGSGLLRQLLLNQVLPRYLAHSGELMLHASAVTLPGGSTVAFLGESGYGKSTLASYCQLQGGQIIDDDCILLRTDSRGVNVIGGVPTLRLYPDSLTALGHDSAGFAVCSDGSSKRQMRLTGRATPAPVARRLDALFLLRAPSGSTAVGVERAGGQAGMMSILGSAFNLDPTDPQTLSGTFGGVARMLEQGLPVYHLHYPRAHAALPRVLEALSSFPIPG